MKKEDVLRHTFGKLETDKPTQQIIDEIDMELDSE